LTSQNETQEEVSAAFHENGKNPKTTTKKKGLRERLLGKDLMAEASLVRKVGVYLGGMLEAAT